MKLIQVLKGVGFTEHKFNPCLLLKWDEEGITLLGIYVDGCLVIGREIQISKQIVNLQDIGFILNIENNLTDYMCRCVIENETKNEIVIMQPHLIHYRIIKFGYEVHEKRVYKIPGTPRFKIVRPDVNYTLIEPKLQKRYCSGVGMLNYLTKYSRPDISNVVREFSRCMYSATMGSYHEMLRVVKFVLDKKTFCLKIRPKIDGKI
jgi:hypothetical protein